MQAFVFEFYIFSLALIAKYNAFASEIGAEELSGATAKQQTTFTDDAPGQHEGSPTDDMNLKGKFSQFDHYKKLFNEHRATQLNAVKAMQKFGSQEAQYKLVNVMLNQLFKNLHEAAQNLTAWGYLPGDEFPQNQTIRECMSKVLENTALFGDMLLRMPSAVHEFFDKNREWQLVLNWAYTFSTQSEVFEGPHEMMLSLMAQEAGIIAKSPNYVNPFLDSAEEAAKDKVPVEVVSKKEKQKKAKKIPRGPRMSRTDL